MGIQQLESFVEKKKNEGLCRFVQLGPLAEQYMHQTGKKPILVVDGTYFVHHYYSRSGIVRDYLCGGQFKEFIGFTKYFVHKFRVLGIEPVFYFDGPTIEAKKDCRKRRNSVKAGLLSTLFNIINGSEGGSTSQFSDKMLPVLISVCGRFICKYECNCTVLVSFTDCDKELADYANRESCFAILSQDTDFLCLKNATYYLSIKHLNLDGMSTMLYDRCAILAYYSFTVQQMWLFASLLGNDVIPRSKLQKFHKILCGNSYSLEKKCKKVASFVRRVTENCSDDVEVIVPAIVEHLDVLDLKITASELKASLRSYQPSEMESWIMDKDIDKSWLQVLEMAYSRHRECEAVPDVYNILAGHSYEIGLFLEKPSAECQESSRIFLTLRQRIYSLLLHEKPWGNTAHEVKEFGQWDNKWHDSEIVDVPDLDKSIHHPGLVALWTKDTQRINLQRWALFAKAISPNLDPLVFERLSYRYVVPVAVLLYLLNLPQNEPQYHPKNQQQQQSQQIPDKELKNEEQNWNHEGHQESIKQEPKNRSKNQRRRRRKLKEYQQKEGPNEEQQQQKWGRREDHHLLREGSKEEVHQLKQGPILEQHQLKQGPLLEQHQKKQGPKEEQHQPKWGPVFEQLQQKQGPAEELHQQKLEPKEEQHQPKWGPEFEQHQQKWEPMEEQNLQKLVLERLEEQLQLEWGPILGQYQQKQGPSEDCHQQEQEPSKADHELNLVPKEEQHQLKQYVPEREQQLQNHQQPKQVNCYLYDHEIESFIKQAVAVMSLEPVLLKPENLLHKTCLTERMLNLSTLFGHGISMVLFLMSVLGFPLHKVMPWYYFDGPLFNYFLARGNSTDEGFSIFSSALCDKQMQNHILEDVEIIRAIVNANRRRGSEIRRGNGHREAFANGDSGIEL